ncbi:helix-turn-helix domain-containing protein [Erwinia sp. CGal63]|uniref:helix-turn-helix domain-containing protein n=1 Tax=Erwinia sp. CGal63 TaxID=2919889 RepID=UPI0030091BCC
MAKKIIYKNKTYSSLSALVKENSDAKIPYSVVATRLKMGWSLDDALMKKKNKNISREYKVDGKTFSTLRALAEAAGISYNAAVKRAHQDWSDKEIFYGKVREVKEKTKPERVKRGNPLIIQGVTYDNTTHAYQQLQPAISLNTVRTRLKMGWKPEHAFDVIVKTDGRKNKKSRTLTLEGQQITLKEAAKKYNVPYNTILDRINRNASARQAVGLDPVSSDTLLSQKKAYASRQAREIKEYVVEGIAYKNIAALARAYHLSEGLVYNRITINGLSATQAVSKEISARVVINSIEYRSAMNAWEKIGKTPLSTYTGRRKQGLPLEVCLGLQPLPGLERYELDGVCYNTLKEVAEAYKLTLPGLIARTKLMSLEEAVVYKPQCGRFSEKSFEKNPQLANAIGRLYFIEITLPEGLLQKIGITSQQVRNRFNNHETRTILEVTGAMKDVYKVEQVVLKNFSHLLYRAGESFGGKTETFLMLPSEEEKVKTFILSECEKVGLMPVMPQEE